MLGFGEEEALRMVSCERLGSGVRMMVSRLVWEIGQMVVEMLQLEADMKMMV